MAKLEFSGMDEYIKMLRTMEGKTTGLIKRAVYDGAAEVAKAVKGAIEGLPETDGYTKPYNLDQGRDRRSKARTAGRNGSFTYGKRWRIYQHEARLRWI